MAGELSLETASPGTKEVRDIPSRNLGCPSSNLGSGMSRQARKKDRQEHTYKWCPDILESFTGM